MKKKNIACYFADEYTPGIYGMLKNRWNIRQRLTGLILLRMAVIFKFFVGDFFWAYFLYRFVTKPSTSVLWIGRPKINIRSKRSVGVNRWKKKNQPDIMSRKYGRGPARKVSRTRAVNHAGLLFSLFLIRRWCLRFDYNLFTIRFNTSLRNFNLKKKNHSPTKNGHKWPTKVVKVGYVRRFDSL